MRRALTALACATLGAATGLASVALHPRWWGLLLALAATAASLIALRPGWPTRLAWVLGWVGVVGWLAYPRREGDYLIGQNASGLLLIGTGLVLVMVAVATLPPRGRGDSGTAGGPP